MKPRFYVILSAVALVILVIVQLYNISETFETKLEQFNSRHTSLCKEAMYDYQSFEGEFQPDSVFYLLDLYAEDYLFAYQDALSGEERDTLKEELLSIFNRILHLNEKPDLYLADYLEKNGADPDIRSDYYISDLYLLDFDNAIPILVDSTGEVPAEYEWSIPAYSHAIEGNFYRVRYQYFIDFTHRTSIIYRDMTITLVLAVITLVIVLVVFSVTMRNMIIQKRLSDMKTDFINNMTHELKTPLSTIAVASSTLSDETMQKDQSRVKQISTMINKQNKHLSQLIDRILEISIWEKDQVRLKRKEVHIYEFMEEKIKLFQLESNGKNVRISADYKLDKDFVRIDDIHMTTVLNNLWSNAVKYCEGSPEIEVFVSLNAKLLIRVSDNGIGMKREAQKHAFDKFYRAGEGDFKTVRGLGLGLYYVRQIVTAHGGEIELQSIPGKGSTFTISIPTENGS